MKSIYEADRLERLERAMAVIEGLSLVEDHTDGQDAEGNYIFNTMSHIYCVAHAANGKCCDGGTHGNWLGTIEKFEKELKDNKILDVEKHLAIPLKEFKSESEPKLDDSINGH